MKSINFSVLKEKLLDRSKTQTIRCTYLPKYKIGEVIQIKFNKEPIFEAKIIDLYPKQLKDLTLEEANRDGFDSVQALWDVLEELNGIKDLDLWCFVIRFKPQPSITDFGGAGRG